MKRTLSKDIKGHKEVMLEGWLHKKRKMGGLNFLVLRDRAGLTQILVEDEAEMEKLRGLQIGTVLRITGSVVVDERAPNGAEIHKPTIEVITPVTSEPPIEIDKPLDHKSENLDTLFEHRVLGVRNIQEQAIFKIRSYINRYIREFLWANDFTEIQTPKLLAGATEGGAEVFKLDYFGKEATLAQSPQFYKQIMAGAFERVFEIGPAFRAESSATTRHVSEVTMLDLEFAFIDGLDSVMDMIQDMVYTIISELNNNQLELLRKINAPEIKIKSVFPRYTIQEIHDLYLKETKIDVRHEKDLIPDEEKFICEYAKKHHGCEAVFATHFPIEAMKFYHKKADDNETVLWADLLFRGLEIATCPVREYRYEELLKQMIASGLDPKHPGYKYYLQNFEFGMPMHGGCGFGIDRITQKICGLNNVKEAILFPRDINRLAP